MGKKKKYEKMIDAISKDAAQEVCDYIVETGDMGVGLAYMAIMDTMNNFGKEIGKRNVIVAAEMIGRLCARAMEAKEQIK